MVADLYQQIVSFRSTPRFTPRVTSNTELDKCKGDMLVEGGFGGE
jgi:hypothetical protein